jgi:hypothetical protein
MRAQLNRRVCVAVAAMLGGALIAPTAPAGASGQPAGAIVADGRSIVHDVANRTVTMRSGGLSMVFDYATGARLTSLSVDGVERLAGPEAPSTSVVRLADGSTLSSADLDAPPRVEVTDSRVVAEFAMSAADVTVRERWIFTVRGGGISQRIERTYLNAGDAESVIRVVHSGQPQMVWARDAWDNVRKPADGGTLPVGGALLNAAADTRLPPGDPADHAPILGAGQTFGQSFTAAEPFAKVGGKFATYQTTDADMTLTLFRGTPEEGLEAITSQRFDDVVDNSWLYLETEQALPPGHYYLEQSEPSGTIAWWSNSTDYIADGTAYVDRLAGGGDRNLRVGDSVGPLAFPDGLALESGGNRYGAEQGDFAYLDRGHRIALRVSADSDAALVTDHFRRGGVRDPGALETNWIASDEPFAYTNGNPKGYVTPEGQHDAAGGHFSVGGGPYIFSPVEVPNGATQSITLTWHTADWDSYYDVGDLEGIDEGRLAALVNDFGRAIMQDKRIGGSSERSFRSAQAPPFTSVWNIYAAELLQDRNAFAAFRAQMEDIRDGLQRPDGFVRCCYPYEPTRTSPPTYDLTDNVVVWPLAVAELYNLDPRRPWLVRMRDSVRAALDYALRELRAPSGPQAGLLSNYQCGQPAPDTGCAAEWSEWNDQYLIGQVSAYHNVMAYAALTRWAELEREVFDADDQAARYEAAAATIKAKFNADGDDGGFWSPASDTFAYTRDSGGELVKDCSHLFVNGYALQFGLVDGEQRRRLVATSLKRAYDERAWRLHGSNPVSCKTTEPHLFFPFFEDGGVHLVMEQPAAQIGLEIGDRSYDIGYARTVLERYGRDGFWGMSNLQPDTMDVRRDVYQEPWMGNNVVGIWPLYHDIWGFQPRHDGLDLVPFIDASLVGSRVEYDWRGRIPVEVRYSGVERYTVAYDGSAPVRVGWRGREPGIRYVVVEDGRQFIERADADGIVWHDVRGSGSSTVSIRAAEGR